MSWWCFALFNLFLLWVLGYETAPYMNLVCAELCQRQNSSGKRKMIWTFLTEQWINCPWQFRNEIICICIAFGFSHVLFNDVSHTNGVTALKCFSGFDFSPTAESFLFSVWVFLLCPKSVPDAAALLVMFWKDFSQNLYEHPVLFTLASSSLKKKKKSLQQEKPQDFVISWSHWLTENLTLP